MYCLSGRDVLASGMYHVTFQNGAAHVRTIEVKLHGASKRTRTFLRYFQRFSLIVNDSENGR